MVPHSVLCVFQVMPFVVGAREVVHLRGRAASSDESGIVFPARRLLVSLFPGRLVHRSFLSGRSAPVSAARAATNAG